MAAPATAGASDATSSGPERACRAHARALPPHRSAQTGTSYLQKLFLENRALLLEAGLGLGPYQNPRTGSHHPILAAFRDEGPARVFARVAECPGARLLISVEQLSAEMLDRATAEAWRDAARAHFEVKVIIFLRRQDYLKESVFAQIVKDWYTGGILQDDHYDYDHDARLALLEAVFGAGNVTPILYRDPGPNDLVGDLLGAMGIALDRDRLAPVPAQNVSMGRRKVLFLSQLPKPRRAESSARARALPLFVAGVVARSPAIADDGERFLMSPRARHELVAGHLAGNRALVARHGIAGGRAAASSRRPIPTRPGPRRRRSAAPRPWGSGGRCWPPAARAAACRARCGCRRGRRPTSPRCCCGGRGGRPPPSRAPRCRCADPGARTGGPRPSGRARRIRVRRAAPRPPRPAPAAAHPPLTLRPDGTNRLRRAAATVPGQSGGA